MDFVPFSGIGFILVLIGAWLFTLALAFVLLTRWLTRNMAAKLAELTNSKLAELTIGMMPTIPTTDGGLSASEAASAAERQVAVSADALTREFESRMKAEVDIAIKRLAASADVLLREQLSDRIDRNIGTDIVEVIGQKLASSVVEFNSISKLREDVSDRFIQMRSRALQYADSANRQSAFFRYIGISLALIGLCGIGTVALLTFEQYWLRPELMQQHIEWQVLLLRHSSSYGFVALCEFLALIMFRYQSKALEYMRYFSNEATNIDARHVAYVSALHYLDKTKIARLIEKLEATERNFLINKSQKTLEMANNENEDRLLDKFKKIFDNLYPGAQGKQKTSSR